MKKGPAIFLSFKISIKLSLFQYRFLTSLFHLRLTSSFVINLINLISSYVLINFELFKLSIESSKMKPF